jgi:hypothetical protein
MGLWRSARAKLILSAPLVLMLVIVIVLALRLSATSSADATSTRHGSASVASAVPSYHPLRVVPPQTAIERTVNQGFARLWRGESASTAAKLPSAATSTNYPPIDATDTQAPSTYALAFTQELLDIDFAASTRQELLAWASYNDAPNSTVTIPVAINLKVLPASLTMNPTPIPTSMQWKKLAASRTSWRVSGLVTSVSPIWTELLATGWQPVDPLMTMYDVSGTLTVTTPGHGPDVESFFFLLTLGGASWHPGYGAVVMNNWTVN